MALKPVSNPKAFYNVVVLKDGTEISTFDRKIKGSALVVETFVDLAVPASVKVLKESAKGKGKSARVYRMMEIPVSAIEGLKGK